MGDNGVVLFVSKHLDTEYCFFEDYMTVNGTPLRYSEMVDISEVTGENPAFEFNYGGKHFSLPYDPRYREEITPYFVKAALIEPQIALDSKQEEPVVEEPVPEYAQEAPVPEEPVVEDFPEAPVPEEPAPEYAQETPAPEEPVVEDFPDTSVPEEPAPEYAQETPAPEEPVVEDFPDAPVPEEPAPEYAQEVPVPEEPAPEYAQETPAPASSKAGSILSRLGGISKKTLIIVAAIVAAIVIGIVIMVNSSGKSVDGLDKRVKLETIENDTGDDLYLAKIQEDAEVEDYALDFYEKCVTNKDEVFWVMNTEKDTTTVFVPQDDSVLIIEFRSVEGEDKDPSLIGKGDVLNTWIMYPDKDQIISV